MRLPNEKFIPIGSFVTEYIRYRFSVVEGLVLWQINLDDLKCTLPPEFFFFYLGHLASWPVKYKCALSRIVGLSKLFLLLRQ